MMNMAKTAYVAVSGPDAAGKREPLKKTGLAASISAFLDAHAPGVQVLPVEFRCRPWSSGVVRCGPAENDPLG
jgi:hypothetical protein